MELLSEQSELSNSGEGLNDAIADHEGQFDVRNDGDYPRPLRERENLLNECNEFSKLGEGLDNAIADRTSFVRNNGSFIQRLSGKWLCYPHKCLINLLQCLSGKWLRHGNDAMCYPDDVSSRHPELDSGSCNSYYGKTLSLTITSHKRYSIVCSAESRGREQVSFAEQTEKTSPAFVARFARTTAPSPNLGERIVGRGRSCSAVQNTQTRLTPTTKQGRGEVKKCAFTLAEVLITLGIIGVVAAMTMPNLIANYQKDVMVKKAKRTYNVLNNAFERAKADYGTDVTYWDWEGTTNKEKSMNFAEKYMLPYLNTIFYSGNKSVYQTFKGYNGIHAIYGEDRDGVLFVLNDGTIVYLKVGTNNGAEETSGLDYNRVLINFDIDGKRGKNRYGNDIFMIELGGVRGSLSGSNFNVRNKFLPYLYYSSIECDEYLTHGYRGWHACDNEEGSTRYSCLAYIMCNGWQAGDKYPW